ncbi:MAG: hypothetical protein ACEY3L_15230 [Wolbachia sp.]
MSSQCLTLGSSFLDKFTKSVSFYNAKSILTKPNALLAISIPVSSTGMTEKGALPSYWITPFISIAVFSILFCHPTERIPYEKLLRIFI